MQNLQIDLSEGFNNPAKAKEITKQLQDSYNTIYEGFEEAKALAESNLELAESFEKQISSLTESNLASTDAIKAIHRVLGAHAEHVDKVEALKVLRVELSKIILSSGMIKAGVISKGAADEKSESP